MMVPPMMAEPWQWKDQRAKKPQQRVRKHAIALLCSDSDVMLLKSVGLCVVIGHGEPISSKRNFLCLPDGLSSCPSISQ